MKNRKRTEAENVVIRAIFMRSQQMQPRAIFDASVPDAIRIRTTVKVIEILKRAQRLQ